MAATRAPSVHAAPRRAISCSAYCTPSTSPAAASRLMTAVASSWVGLLVARPPLSGAGRGRGSSRRASSLLQCESREEDGAAEKWRRRPPLPRRRRCKRGRHLFEYMARKRNGFRTGKGASERVLCVNVPTPSCLPSLLSTIHHFPHRFPNPRRLRAAAMAPPPPPPPDLMIDAVSDILLRIPPDDPALLLRASLVCKPWRRLLNDPAFIRRYRAFHRTPPLLGFFRTSAYRDFDLEILGFAPISTSVPTESDLTFVPTSAFRTRSPKRHNCRLLDCRHGCVLLYDHTTRGLLVWDPITGEDHHIPNNIGISFSCPLYNAAVLCAAADCDHLGCHGSPFLVVLAITYFPKDEDEDEYEGYDGSVFVYSSEAGEWSAPTTVKVDNRDCCIEQRPPVLTGDKIYFACESNGEILCCDLRGDKSLSLIRTPWRTVVDSIHPIVLVPVEDGGLRIAWLGDSNNIVMWSLETIDPDGVASWTRLRIVPFNPLASGFRDLRMVVHMCPKNLSGFAKHPCWHCSFRGHLCRYLHD